MQQESDFILREIQRLNFVLTRSIEKALGSNTNELELNLLEIESDLKTELDLTLEEICMSSDLDLLKKIAGMNEMHLEKLVELIVAVMNNAQGDYAKKLSQKGLIILNFLEKNTNTYFLSRTELKNMLLEKHLISDNFFFNPQFCQQENKMLSIWMGRS